MRSRTLRAPVLSFLGLRWRQRGSPAITLKRAIGFCWLLRKAIRTFSGQHPATSVEGAVDSFSLLVERDKNPITPTCLKGRNSLSCGRRRFSMKARALAIKGDLAFAGTPRSSWSSETSYGPKAESVPMLWLRENPVFLDDLTASAVADVNPPTSIGRLNLVPSARVSCSQYGDVTWSAISPPPRSSFLFISFSEVALTTKSASSYVIHLQKHATKSGVQLTDVHRQAEEEKRKFCRPCVCLCVALRSGNASHDWPL